MDTARQVVRWSIPGWLFLLAYGLLLLAYSLCWVGDAGSFLGRLSSAGVSLVVAALVVTAGVPLGFLLYQVYYALYGGLMPFSIVNRDRGAEILEGIQTERLWDLCDRGLCKPRFDVTYSAQALLGFYPILRLDRRYRNRDGRRAFRDQLEANWETVRFALTVISLRLEKGEPKAEITGLADIYHGIGAARVSVVASMLLHLFTVSAVDWWRWKNVPLQMGLSLAICYLPCVLVIYVLEVTRRHTLNSLLHLIRSIVGWYCRTDDDLSKCSLVASEPIPPK